MEILFSSGNSSHNGITDPRGNPFLLFAPFIIFDLCYIGVSIQLSHASHGNYERSQYFPCCFCFISLSETFVGGETTVRFLFFCLPSFFLYSPSVNNIIV